MKTLDKQFDEKFGYKPHPNYGYNYDLKAQDVKSFLKEKIKETIDEMVVEKKEELSQEELKSHPENCQCHRSRDGYNEACQKQLRLKNKLYKKLGL